MYDLVAKLISKGCKCAIEILGKETEKTIAPYSGDQAHQPTTVHCLTILWLITCPRPTHAAGFSFSAIQDVTLCIHTQVYFCQGHTVPARYFD